MKNFLYMVLFLCSWQLSYTQDTSGYRIKASSLGSSGSSQHIETSKGTYKVSQSIGQGSVIGTHRNKSYVLRQGYQQPLEGKNTVEIFVSELKAKVYPNPFNQELVISFSEVIMNAISVTIFDINGKIIHTQEFSQVQKLQLQLKTFSAGNYLLKVVSGKKRFQTKVIKI